MSSDSFAEQGADSGSPSSAESNYRRYVDDDPALPYKTRGFYLSVVMDHRRVPELIAALTANGTNWTTSVVGSSGSTNEIPESSRGCPWPSQ